MKPIRMTYTPDIFRVMVVVLMANGNDMLPSKTIVDSSAFGGEVAKEEIRSH